jgi:pimeloyl-ACP methyl ester carboxylesterase
MCDLMDTKRRHFLQTAGIGAAGLAATGFGLIATTRAQTTSLPNQPVSPGVAITMGPIRHIRTDILNIGYFETGPSGGQVVLLLHGYPYDIHSFVDVAPMLAAQGYRVIVPYLRGHGSTRFLDAATPRAGQQGAIGADVTALMDALKIPAAVLAGFDWGGRAACVAAALWPDRCKGLVSVNSYLIQDIAHAMTPIPAKIESGLWYQYYFQTERGRAGLAADRRGVARVIWTRNSPSWRFDEATFERTAMAFDNRDYVDVVIHSYRHRLGLAPGYPAYEEIEQKLAAQPIITVPAITLDGAADGNYPASDGSATAAKFRGPRIHRQVPDAGHNLPQEAPRAFADAVMELMKAG